MFSALLQTARGKIFEDNNNWTSLHSHVTAALSKTALVGGYRQAIYTLCSHCSLPAHTVYQSVSNSGSCADPNVHMYPLTYCKYNHA